MKTKNLIIFAAVILLLPAMVSAQAPPDVKNATTFTGSVTINGAAAPDGTCIKAIGGGGGTDCPGSEGGGTTNGIYSVSVLFQGAPETITFSINGAIAAQTWSLTASDKGRTISLDLSLPSGGGPGGGGEPGPGGGGGGAPSGENVSNIEVKECYDKEIFKDILTSYQYTHPVNPVNFVNITGNVNSGVITACVEVLKGTSSLVGSGAPGTVYRNFNIWVGTKGFATPGNIKDARIVVEVSNSWFTSNNIAASKLSLLKWDGSKWIALGTTQTGQDAASTYFESGTTSFSSFAISGESGITPVPTPGPTVSPVVTVTATPPVQPPAALNWILYLVIAIIIIVAVYFLAIKKKQ